MFETGKVLTQWALVYLGKPIKTNNYSQTCKCNKEPYDVTKKNSKGLSE